MTRMSRCNLPLPLPSDFDCVAHATRLPDIAPSATWDLRMINKKNIIAEKFNETSITLTDAYEAARGTPRGVGDLDVGSPLQPLYAYSDVDKELMVSSNQYCDAVGPLPSSLVRYITEEHLKKDRADADEKAKREKERADKEAEKLKANSSIAGTLLMSNPHEISSVLSGPAVIPPLFAISLRNRVVLPLHYWTDEMLRLAAERPHEIPKELIRAEQTSTLVTPERVQVVDVLKAVKLYGGEEKSAALTPSLWRQASRNLLAAWVYLCPAIVPNDPTSPQNTYASEYDLHVRFFANLKVFDDLPQVWYPIEYELRLAIFNCALFNEHLWSSRVDIGVNSYKQAKHFSSLFSVHPTSGLTAPHSLKRPAPDDGNSAFAKAPRNVNSSNARGGGGSSRESSVPRLPPLCLVCTGPHNAHDHPPDLTSFRDGAPYFCKVDGRDVRSVGSFRGSANRALCILYNVGAACPGGHEPERLHACTFCGGSHRALSRDRACKRVKDGAFVP
ncbi:hypothetical protein B0H15DRAFT_35934 [Mycena belliarum]|uniref:Uncharacterized protein n=1 Tax=Mycena belliarum TaxID=1033014 RepID=A0AAD6UE57_9AGAR|nr:hypothetical protein B0H15DRAFT_35934 [Mycena belliae]